MASASSTTSGPSDSKITDSEITAIKHFSNSKEFTLDQLTDIARMGVTLVRFDFDRGTKVWKDEQLENLPGMLKGYTDSSISTAIESKKKLLNFSQLPKRWQERYSEAAEAARKDAKGEKEKFNNKEEDPSDALVLKHLKKTFDLTTFNALKLDWFLAKSVLQTRRNEGTA